MNISSLSSQKNQKDMQPLLDILRNGYTIVLEGACNYGDNIRHHGDGNYHPIMKIIPLPNEHFLICSTSTYEGDDWEKKMGTLEDVQLALQGWSDQDYYFSIIMSDDYDCNVK